jgi:hypothetical protein
MKTKSAAIAHAKQFTSAMMPNGSGWYYTTYDADLQAWYQRQPTGYSQAVSNRAQSMIDLACEFLGVDAPQYNGGKWTDYVVAHAPRDPRCTCHLAGDQVGPVPHYCPACDGDYMSFLASCNCD